MNAAERRAVATLALVYALRMLGMFMVLPVLALYARDFAVPVSDLQIGLAIGLYGLTQALLQIPLGWLSDHIGRRPVVLGGLAVFALGSLIAGQAETVDGLLLGRAVQGMGAVSAAVSAWIADVTRPTVRTTAMAILGVGMGGAFILALVLGPVAAAAVGVDGIFYGTGIAAVLAMLLVALAVPVAPPQPASRGGLGRSLRDPELLRLNGGILILHAVMAALFVALPLALVDRLGWAAASHWKLYLPVLLLSVLPVFPLIRHAERRGQIRPVFLLAVAALSVALGVLGLSLDSLPWLVAGLLLFFVAFNFLEGALPSLISRRAPPQQKGATLGVYASSQFIGGFAGGLLGGLALQFGGLPAVFAGAATLPLLWWVFAAGMASSAAVDPSPHSSGVPHGPRRQ
jgi:MFS family permease